MLLSELDPHRAGTLAEQGAARRLDPPPTTGRACRNSLRSVCVSMAGIRSWTIC